MGVPLPGAAQAALAGLGRRGGDSADVRSAGCNEQRRRKVRVIIFMKATRIPAPSDAAAGKFSYSSAQLMSFGDKPQLLFVSDGGLFAFDPWIGGDFTSTAGRGGMPFAAPARTPLEPVTASVRIRRPDGISTARLSHISGHRAWRCRP